MDILNIVLVRKNNDFAEYKGNLIHSKLVPLLHNTVLILGNKGAGFVAMHITYKVLLYLDI